jgi:hypothetical protein
MMSEKANPYYDPEKLGLTTIAELDDSEANYSFDMVVAWRHEDGSIYWQQDSGCSCPSPFEDYTELSMLNRAAPDLHDLQQAVDAHEHHTLVEAEAFMAAVRKAQKA